MSSITTVPSKNQETSSIESIDALLTLLEGKLMKLNFSRPLLLVGTLLLSVISLTAASKAEARGYYGSIAYSKSTGSTGYSYDYIARDIADAVARDSCEKYSRSGDCEIVVRYGAGTCGALATSSNGPFGTGFATDGRRDYANSLAIRYCNNFGGQYCKVIQSVCNSR